MIKSEERRESSGRSCGLFISISLCAALAASPVFARGGTAKPPSPKNPPPPVNVAPAPDPVTRTFPNTVRFLTPPTAAQDALDHGFDITGFVESFGPIDQCGGGSAIVNGLNVTIPCNLVLQMPANTISWQDFATTYSQQIPPGPANAAYDQATIAGNGASTNPSMELHLIGNTVNGQYIAAFAYASQQSVNNGYGVITSIDYSTGRLVVSSNGRTVELEINDPKQRFTRGGTNGGTVRDDRLSVDDQNPTIVASTGYPMCVPRTNPAAADDARCPQKNRPTGVCRDIISGLGITPPTGGAGIFFANGLNGGTSPGGARYCTSFVMKAPPGTPTDPVTLYPPAAAIAGATEPDAREQAPFEVGDSLTWSGTLLRGVKGVNNNDIYSVHTITANVGIFTQPGTLPVYLHIGEFGIAGDAAVARTSLAGISQEVQNRLALEADVTDITAIVDIFLVDQDTAGFEINRWVTPLNMTGRNNLGQDTTKLTLIGFQGNTILVPGTGVFYPFPAGYGVEGGIVTQYEGAQLTRARIRATKATPGILTNPSRTIRAVARTLCTPQNINPTTWSGQNITFAGITNVTSAIGSGGLGWTAQNTSSTNIPGVTADGTTCLGRATAANGLQTGEYTAPVFEFIFPENTGRGDPVVSNNFWNLNFLSGDAFAAQPLTPQPW